MRNQAPPLDFRRYMDEGYLLDRIIESAYISVEKDLTLEDAGWIKLGSNVGADVFSASERKENVQKSRVYAMKDPLGRQSIRLWTDYTFGTGLSWNAKDESAKQVLSDFWDAPINRPVLSARGQRKNSDKLLIDGEIFFAVFLGEPCSIRTVDPLEITEIITDPDDLESVKYYKREWLDTKSALQGGYYRSIQNKEDKPYSDTYGRSVKATEDAIILHLAINTIGQRGNPLLLPALEWIKYYRQFLASRIAIMLALARFAWRQKVQGGQAAVTTIKAKTQDVLPAAGATIIENLGVDTQPIRTDSNAQNAYQDGRQIKLQIAAGVGIPEQYFGDISIGNLATAKTVELPLIKQFESYQAIWRDSINDLLQLVLEHGGIPEKSGSDNPRYVDIDFPEIMPEDAQVIAQSLAMLLPVMPDLGYSDDVVQQALMSLGVHNTNEVIEALKALRTQESRNPTRALSLALRDFRKVLKDGHNGLS